MLIIVICELTFSGSQTIILNHGSKINILNLNGINWSSSLIRYCMILSREMPLDNKLTDFICLPQYCVIINNTLELH